MDEVAEIKDRWGKLLDRSESMTPEGAATMIAMWATLNVDKLIRLATLEQSSKEISHDR